MRRRHAGLLIASAVLVGQMLLAAPAGAATVVVNGAFDGSEPTMDVVGINGSQCGSQGGFTVAYQVYEIAAPIPGPNEIELVSDPAAAVSIYLFEGSFDPDNAAVNCVAAANSETNTPRHISYEFAPDTAYIIVVINDSFNQEPATYQLTYQSDEDPPPPPPPPPPPTPEVVEPGPSSGGATPVAAAPRFTG